MKYLYYLLFTLTIVSCRNGMKGSGNIIRETRQASDINSVSVSGPIKVDVKQGNTASLIVEADDNIMPYVITNIKGKDLSIKLKGLNNLRNATVNIHLVIPMIWNLATSASAEIRSTEILKNTEKISISASSGSLINVIVDAPIIDVKGSSGSEITISGRTKDLMAESSSGSSLNLYTLSAETAKASASSGAKISLFASVGINASASSGGSINYQGSAASVVKNVSSGGSVSPE